MHSSPLWPFLIISLRPSSTFRLTATHTLEVSTQIGLVSEKLGPNYMPLFQGFGQGIAEQALDQN